MPVFRFRLQVDRQLSPEGLLECWRVRGYRQKVCGPPAETDLPLVERFLPPLPSSGEEDFPRPPDGGPPCSSPAEPLPDLLVDPASGALSANRLEEVFAQVNDRSVSSADFRLYGRYLFDTLIGKAAWDKIQEAALIEAAQAYQAASAGAPAGPGGAALPIIELALCWPTDDFELHRLHWEAMYDGQRFLASLVRDPLSTASAPALQLILVPTVITRLVPTGAGVNPPQPVKPPVRTLFAIGVPLTDEEIRPAAEILGLQRQLRQSNQEFALAMRLLDKISPARLQAAVADFCPQTIHFISHGNVTQGKGPYLMMAPEPGEKEPQKLYAGDLLNRLAAAGQPLPLAAVLSACYTSSQGEKPGQPAGPGRMMNGAENAPLAAALVKGGIPIVVGMAGRVADLACRLFTRGFSSALMEGKPLLVATAWARWAALTAPDAGSSWVDWAFPALYLAECVSPDFIPLDRSSVSEAELIESWVSNSGFLRSPVFCGRQEILQEYYDLFSPREDPPVLVIEAGDQEEGLGRFRLLAEMAIQAIREGHLPVLLGSDTAWQPPKDPLDLAYALHGEIKRLRTSVYQDAGGGLGFNWKANPRLIQVELLHINRQNPQTLGSESRLAPEVDALLPINYASIPVEAVKLALQIELAELVKDARLRFPAILGPHSRPVILLLKVEDYDQALEALLLDSQPWLGQYGLGDAPGQGVLKAPVPVVLVYSKYGNLASVNAPDQLTAQFESRVAGLKFRRARLELFNSDTEEDVLVYLRVLLNPFQKELVPGKPFKPLAVHPSLDVGLRKFIIGLMRLVAGGRPVNLLGEKFREAVHLTLTQNYLIEARDQEILEDLAKQYPELG
jgi:hypothetical protein